MGPTPGNRSGGDGGGGWTAGEAFSREESLKLMILNNTTIAAIFAVTFNSVDIISTSRWSTPTWKSNHLVVPLDLAHAPDPGRHRVLRGGGGGGGGGGGRGGGVTAV